MRVTCTSVHQTGAHHHLVPRVRLPMKDLGVNQLLMELSHLFDHSHVCYGETRLLLKHVDITDMLGRTGRGKVHFGDHAGWGSAEFLTKFGKTLGQFEAKTGEFQKVDFYFCCGISDFGCYHGILEKQHLADGHLKSTISLIIQKQANFKCGNL